MEIKKVGIRIESRYHEIDEDAGEAYCYFAEMVDAVAEFDEELEDGSEDKLTADEAAKITKLIRDIFEEEDEAVEIYTEGELYCGDGKIEVRYREPSEVTGMGESVTSISFEESDRDIVTITRGGDVYSALVLERGVRHACAYNTDTMPFIIYTMAKRIDNGLTESGGVLDMIYTVEAQHGAAQFNRVTVTVTEQEPVCLY